jgi:hypothetical protein
MLFETKAQKKKGRWSELDQERVEIKYREKDTEKDNNKTSRIRGLA